MNFRQSRGFTLIELLVVVSIIGLLSSIMFTALQGAKDKSRIGASLQFASGVDNALGGAPLAWWDFSDCTGTALIDRGGNRYNGTLQGGMSTASWLTDIPYVNQTCSLSFNGSSNYIDFSTMTGSYSGGYTIAFWAKPNTIGTLAPVGSRTTGDNSFDIRFDAGTTIHTSIGNGTAWLANVDIPLRYDTGKWYHLAVVARVNSYSIYANGKVIADGTYTGTPLLYDATHSLRLGTSGTANWFNGLITHVHLFNGVVASNDIERLYAEESGAMNVAVR